MPLSDNPGTALLVQVVDGLGDSIEVARADGVLIYVNEAFERLTGYPRQEALGRTPRELLRSDAHPDSFFDEIWEHLVRGNTWAGQVSSRTRSGEQRTFHVAVTPLTDAHGELQHIVALRRDMTEQIELQNQLAQAERLAAVGRLAAGVAHEINNPLTFLVSGIEELGELAQSDARDPVRVEELIDLLTDGARRISDIVRDLRTFARGSPRDSWTSVELEPAVQRVLNLVRHELEAQADLTVELAPVPPIFGDATHVGQIVLNLLLNAVEALDAERGAISVRMTTSHDHVHIEVTDDGQGIEAQELHKVFDPFYTTKDPGTGLGLSVSRKLTESMGGTLTISSNPGLGTTARVSFPTLPRLAEAMADATPSGPESSEVDPGEIESARILVIDDDPQVLRAVVRMLRPHDVVGRSTVADGLAFLEDHELDLVFCDVMMPGEGGVDFDRHVRERFPHLVDRVVYLTGGAYTPRTSAFLQRPDIESLAKPLPPHRFHRWVAEFIKKRRSQD